MSQDDAGNSDQPGHFPVLRQEVLDTLAPQGRRVLLDCTVGLGGHSEALLEAAGEGSQLIGIDLDEANLAGARQRLSRFAGRVRLFKANFSQADEVIQHAGVEAVDLIIADLGIASTQLDDPSRGLSFMADGPLDMRLDVTADRTAADLINHLGEQELADVIYRYGEERYSRRIAAAIVAARKTARVERTSQLEQIVFHAMPAAVRRSREGAHPATRTFQALRIAVNHELESLEKLLALLPGLLTTGGRAGIISFHSLEDRLVKRFFLDWASRFTGKIVTRKPITPNADEIVRNPRSRSAKLRVIEKVQP